jgi:hypothetical protein
MALPSSLLLTDILGTPPTAYVGGYRFTPNTALTVNQTRINSITTTSLSTTVRVFRVSDQALMGSVNWNTNQSGWTSWVNFPSPIELASGVEYLVAVHRVGSATLHARVRPTGEVTFASEVAHNGNIRAANSGDQSAYPVDADGGSYANVWGVDLYLEAGGPAPVSLLLTPNGHVSASGMVDQAAGTTNLHLALDEGVATPDNDATYVVNSGNADASLSLDLSAPPGDFESLLTLGATVRLRRA